ncbi:Neutral ceramidase B [Venturia nashicola]|uniref:Neutral ceramidase B n=1 Tax=Venturia nashicola TaxID=86259 RepID=A0A4Z1P5J4_9PEZI|nr:Neutral ceramidase B [Venturia nashicola]TLD36739.1 Neutral ceramidase B [Venturia nashicola]
MSIQAAKKSEPEVNTDNGDEPALQKPDTSMNKAKWLACIALCLANTTQFQQQCTTSVILKYIDEKLGPTTYYNWMLTAYTIAVAVSLPISGGLSDIFGRRRFIICGCCISLVGTSIAIGAQNIPMMIAAMTFKGIGSGGQQLALAAIAEIVPNKHRGNAQAVLAFVTLPWAVFSSITGNAMIKYYALGFRINFIIGTGLNTISIISLWLWYHPPARTRIVGKTQWERVRNLDWIGIILMATGIVLFLMGLAFGGRQFPWASAGTIAPIVIGVLSLVALGFWEWKVAKEPFFAHELFIGQGRTFPLFLVITFVGGMNLYASGAFWTQQVQGMFSHDPITIGLSTMPGGCGGAVGGFVGGYLMGKHRFLTSRLMLMYGVAIKMIADGVFTTVTPSDFKMAMGLGFLAMFGVGFMLNGLIVCVQLSCKDEHIGLATLVQGSLKAMGGSLAVTIFSSTIQNTQKKDAGPRVAKAVMQPPYRVAQEELPTLIKLVVGGKDQLAAKLPGVSPEAVKATRQVLKLTWALAFKRIYLITLAFSLVAFIAAIASRDVTDNMTDHVAVKLQNDHSKEEKKLDVEGRS